MEDDQQFCLRWNNHQSTLVAVFDTLLENGTLVDCTLAAEGKYLNAHKVVLSACSPYFESLLAQNYDKHPIFILKDVKFQELKAMMDYMYRGEVNISQDQLGALLKAAESLQIKGLSDNKKEEPRKPVSAPAKSPPPTTTLPRVQGLTIEQRRANQSVDDREGSQSPGPRKRKRIRRRSTEDLDNHHDASNSSESHSNPPIIQNIPTALPPASSSKIIADVPEPIETKSDIITRHKVSSESEVPIIKEKIETHSELILEPKSEYVEEMNEDSIEDLTLDDDEVSNLEMSNDGAGPSHGNMGEGSSQGFAGWHMGNQSQDEVFLAAQEAVGAHRDSQAFVMSNTECDCKPEITESPQAAVNDLLPTKSGSIYQAVYQKFIKWCEEKNEYDYTESTLLAYFSEQAIVMKMKCSTMWSQYSMIRSLLNINHGVDISKYFKLRAYLKKQNKGFTPKKSRVFTKEQFEKFLSEASDMKYLGMKMVLIIGISGALRCDEMVRMKIDDIEDFGSLLHIKIPDNKTNKTRSFTVAGENFINIYRKYASLRPEGMHDRRFFLKYNNGKCHRLVMGIHKFGSVPREVASYLNLPNWKEYTGHSLRRTAATLMLV